MEVTCCGDSAQAFKSTLFDSGKMILWNVVIISTEGNIVEE